jgi:hypothetical protein
LACWLLPAAVGVPLIIRASFRHPLARLPSPPWLENVLPVLDRDTLGAKGAKYLDGGARRIRQGGALLPQAAQLAALKGHWWDAAAVSKAFQKTLPHSFETGFPPSD